jgi:hypothetical protein
MVAFYCTGYLAEPCSDRNHPIFMIRDIRGRGAILNEPEEPKDQLPATITSADITADQHALNVVPALIADLGDEAAGRYAEFFTANIRNPHTRRAYARACDRFFAWCEQRGLTLAAIRPFDVATYIEGLQQNHSAPGVKQQLAALRMLFDWLVVGPGASYQSGGRRARTEACGEDRQDAGARGRRMAQAARLHSGHDIARSARPCADRHSHLQLRAHQRGSEDEGRGSPAARCGMDDPAA